MRKLIVVVAVAGIGLVLRPNAPEPKPVAEVKPNETPRKKPEYCTVIAVIGASKSGEEGEIIRTSSCGEKSLTD